jgi:hypothetical protein
MELSPSWKTASYTATKKNCQYIIELLNNNNNNNNKFILFVKYSSGDQIKKC